MFEREARREKILEARHRELRLKDRVKSSVGDGAPTSGHPWTRRSPPCGELNVNNLDIFVSTNDSRFLFMSFNRCLIDAYWTFNLSFIIDLFFLPLYLFHVSSLDTNAVHFMLTFFYSHRVRRFERCYLGQLYNCTFNWLRYFHFHKVLSQTTGSFLSFRNQ